MYARILGLSFYFNFTFKLTKLGLPVKMIFYGVARGDTFLGVVRTPDDKDAE
jgi:hypothetical protein